MSVCSIMHCKNVTIGGCGLRFYSFPVNEKVVKSWLLHCKPNTSVRTGKVCSLHFANSDVYMPMLQDTATTKDLALKFMEVKPGAVPTLYLGNCEKSILDVSRKCARTLTIRKISMDAQKAIPPKPALPELTIALSSATKTILPVKSHVDEICKDPTPKKDSKPESSATKSILTVNIPDDEIFNIPLPKKDVKPESSTKILVSLHVDKKVERDKKSKDEKNVKFQDPKPKKRGHKSSTTKRSVSMDNTNREASTQTSGSWRSIPVNNIDKKKCNVPIPDAFTVTSPPPSKKTKSSCGDGKDVPNPFPVQPKSKPDVTITASEYSDFMLYKQKYENIKKNLNQIFTPGQIKALGKSDSDSRVKWENEDIKEALKIWKLSPLCYKYLREDVGLPLPGYSTLTSRVPRKTIHSMPEPQVGPRIGDGAQMVEVPSLEGVQVAQLPELPTLEGNLFQTDDSQDLGMPSLDTYMF